MSRNRFPDWSRKLPGQYRVAIKIDYPGTDKLEISVPNASPDFANALAAFVASWMPRLSASSKGGQP